MLNIPVNNIYRNGVNLNYQPTPHDYSKDYLTMNVISGGTIEWRQGYSAESKTIQYSKDDGETWTTLTSSLSTHVTFEVEAGDKVLFKGNNERYMVSGKTSVDCANLFQFISNECQVNIEGNIMSMIGGDNFRGLTSVDSYAFCFLFGSNTNIYDASNLVLPATTLNEACYRSLFDKCWNLVSPPSVLPATTAAQDCYRSMFNLCTGMTSTPELQATTLAPYCCFNMFGKCYSLTIPTSLLPANTLADDCYENMFYQCTGLTTAPELPATILTRRCYSGMFAWCTNLNYIKCLATTGLSSNNLGGWVTEVAASGTFVKKSGVLWPTGTYGIPSGWTVQEV